MVEESLFAAALDLPAGAERRAFLADACGTDADLRARLERLLAADDRAAGILDHVPEPGPPLPRPVPLAAGQTYDGRYRLTRKLGEGGMGEVWAADQTDPVRRPVALKVLRAEYAAAASVAARFVEEAQITARLQHPGIPPVHHVGALPDGRPFLAMKLIAGQTLDVLLKDRGPGSAHWLGVFEAVCQAVGYAHTQGVIHRDLKPANVMVGSFGEVQVMDWGLAKVLPGGPATTALMAPPGDRPPPGDTHLARAGDTPLTRFGSAVGTPAYMAPEQAAGETDRIDRRSDVFGLGGVLCALLTGGPPYPGADAVTVLLKAARGDTGEARARLAGCGAEPDLIALCQWCLTADPAARPADGGVVATAVADLRRAAGERARQAELDRAKAEVRAAEHRKRRRLALAGLGAVSAVLLGGVVGTTVGLVRAERARTAEATHRARAEGARDRAWNALDAMTSKITGETLARQTAVGAEQKQFLAVVLTHYREFAADTADDEAARKRRAAAAYRVGMIEDRLGRKAESAAALRVAGEAYAALAADYPADPAYRHALARSQARLGNLLADLGGEAGTTEAVDLFRTAVAHLADLAAAEPTVAGHRSELAITHDGFGSLLADLGRGTAAEDQYRQGLALRERLAAEAAATAERRRDLADSHINLAKLLADLGQRDEAERRYRRAVALLAGLVDEAPGVAEYRSELAVAAHNLGTLVADRGRRDEAETLYRQGLTLREKLAADYPAVPEYRSLLAISHINLGNLLKDLGKRDAAGEALRRAQGIQERLTTDFPRVPAYRRELAVTHINRAALFLDLGQRAEAEGEYRQAQAVQEKLAAEFPAVPLYQVELGASRYGLGLVVRDGGDPTTSLDWFGQAVRVLAPVHEREPRMVAAARFLRDTYRGRADAHDRLGLHAEAAADWDRAAALSPPRDKPGDDIGRAISLLRAGRPAEAVSAVAAVRTTAGLTATDWYGIACFDAIASTKVADQKQAHADRAMDALKQAVAAGFTDVAHMTADRDLDGLRARADFRALLADLSRRDPSAKSQPKKPVE